MDGAGSKPGVPLAACLHPALKRRKDFIDGVPHNEAAFVHIAVGIPNDLDVGVKLEARQNLATRPTHQGPCLCDRRIDVFNCRLDEQGIMDRCADSDTCFGQVDTRQPQHFSAVGLHQEIAHTAWVEFHD